jgi:hypothetical protein
VGVALTFPTSPNPRAKPSRLALLIIYGDQS